MDINYFILSHQGLKEFEKNYDEVFFKKINLKIIDNGNQKSKKFKNFIYYKTTKNLGCAGGWNLICLIAFNYFKLEKIVIGQDDTQIDYDAIKNCYDLCNENTICGVFSPFFEFSTFSIHKDVFNNIGFFDENCIDVYCEDVDYKQRCYLNNIKIMSLNYNNKKNLGLTRKLNPRIYDTIEANRKYIYSKWGESMNRSKIGKEDYQPPYKYLHPYNDSNLNHKLIKITQRLSRIFNVKDTFPSFLEYKNFKKLSKT